MKRLLIALVLLSTIAGIAQEEPSDIKSHYRLFSSEVFTMTGGTGLKETRLFKIDMRTGETWWFVSMLTTNGVREGWRKVADYNPQEPCAEWRDTLTMVMWLTEHPDGGTMGDLTLSKEAVQRGWADCKKRLTTLMATK
jgi:hypothetical protein